MTTPTRAAGSRQPRLHADRAAHRAGDRRHPRADRVPELPGLHRAQQPAGGAVGARRARQRAGEDLPQLQRVHDQRDRRLYRTVGRRAGLGVTTAHGRKIEGLPVHVLASPATATTFTLTATPVAGTPQAGDGNLTITETGQRTWGSEDLVVEPGRAARPGGQSLLRRCPGDDPGIPARTLRPVAFPVPVRGAGSRDQGGNAFVREKTKGLQPRKPFVVSRRPRRSAPNQIDVSLPSLR